MIDRLADLNAALCGWQLNTPNSAHVFTRWALPMIMDFAEVNPLAAAGGSPDSAVKRAIAYIREVAVSYPGMRRLCCVPLSNTLCLMTPPISLLLIPPITTRFPTRTSWIFSTSG